MEIEYFHVDAFTDRLFSGNPAGVCLVDHWPKDEVMQKIAAENRHSETAFVLKDGSINKIRFFTPQSEINICGHATLSSAFVLLNFKDESSSQVEFVNIDKEVLTVSRNGGSLELILPSIACFEIPMNEIIRKAIDVEIKVLKKSDVMYIVELESELEVKNLVPNLDLIKTLDTHGLVVTAKGSKCDFVTRFFGPQIGVPEDPGTGVAHCVLTKYWNNKTGQKKFKAIQLSERGALFNCEDKGDKTSLIGNAVLYLKGIIKV